MFFFYFVSLQDNLPDLHSHFTHIGVETHMFASQWFLTLYTAKFPLHTVFHIMDVFLSEVSDNTYMVASVVPHFVHS